jgi:hypothetical protein
MKSSSCNDRVGDKMEKRDRFTSLTRDFSLYLLNRYSEHEETAKDLPKRVN